MAGVKRPVCKFELEKLLNIKVDDWDNLKEEQKEKLVAKEALVEWKDQVQTLEAKVEKRTKHTNQLTNELYQLLGLYSVFVGVVFTAVLQSTRVECRHIWSPIVLCLIAYSGTLFIIDKKSKEIDNDRILLNQDDESRKTRGKDIRALKTKGHSAFALHVEQAQEKKEGESDSEASSRKHKKEGESDPEASSRKPWLIGILTLFTLVLVFSFVHILCIHATSCSCP